MSGKRSTARSRATSPKVAQNVEVHDDEVRFDAGPPVLFAQNNSDRIAMKVRAQLLARKPRRSDDVHLRRKRTMAKSRAAKRRIASASASRVNARLSTLSNWNGK